MNDLFPLLLVAAVPMSWLVLWRFLDSTKDIDGGWEKYFVHSCGWRSKAYLSRPNICQKCGQEDNNWTVKVQRFEFIRGWVTK